MAITFDLPASVEETLREELPNLDQEAKEIVLVALYREGKLTHHEFASAMNVTSYDADGILKRHGVTEDLISPEEFAEEQAALDRSAKRR